MKAVGGTGRINVMGEKIEESGVKKGSVYAGEDLTPCHFTNADSLRLIRGRKHTMEASASPFPSFSSSFSNFSFFSFMTEALTCLA